MNISNLRADWNLLKVLYILLEERSVTGAADRLFITQSAVSKTLHRLRILLGDPLFVRSPEGLTPTTRAEELIVPLKNMFEQVDLCLTPKNFDPKSVHGKVRIASPEQFALGAIPALVVQLRVAAPNLQLDSLPLMNDHLNLLSGGALDFVIRLDQPTPAEFHSSKLFSALPMTWCHVEHPLATKEHLNLSDLFSYPHIAFHSQNVAAEDQLKIEVAVKQAGLTRNAILDTEHLLIALEVLSRTDSLMLAPDFLIQIPSFYHNVVQRSISHIPVFDHLKIDLALVQHGRTTHSPLFKWLAKEIKNAFKR